MNRSLAIPLAITMISFCAVYFSQTTYGDPLSTENVVAAISNEPKTTAKPMAFQDARTIVLDQWPTLGEYHFASRMAPSQPLYATLGVLASGMKQKPIDDDDSSYLCTLYISARPKLNERSVSPDAIANQAIRMLDSESNNRFPVHVDRYTKSVHIYAQSKWQDYATWRDVNLPKYKELTGWNVDTAKGYGKNGFPRLQQKNEVETEKADANGRP